MKRVRAIAGLSLLGVLLLALATPVAIHARVASFEERFAADLALERARLASLPRPVLRGEPIDGDARDGYARARDLAGDAGLESVVLKTDSGAEALVDDLLAKIPDGFLAKDGATIEATLAATRCTRCSAEFDYALGLGQALSFGPSTHDVGALLLMDTAVRAPWEPALAASRALAVLRLATDLRNDRELAIAALAIIEWLVTDGWLKAADLSALDGDLAKAEGAVIPAVDHLRAKRLFDDGELGRELHAPRGDAPLFDERYYLRAGRARPRLRSLPLSLRAALGADALDRLYREAEALSSEPGALAMRDRFAALEDALNRFPAALILNCEARRRGWLFEPVLRERLLRARIALVRALAGLARFRLERGWLPASLEEAIAPPPVDPYDDEARLRYALAPDGRSARVASASGTELELPPLAGK